MFGSKRKRAIRFALFSVLFGLFVWSCTTVPITGRSQLALVPEGEIIAMADAQYDTFLMNNKLSNNKEATAMIKRCGSRIQKAVESYFASQNASDQLKGYQWEFNLVESDEVNAWCMPGGKVVFYSGILPVCKDETGIAVVMGHEVAHAVARHGNERMSQGLLAQFGSVALDAALANNSATTKQIAATAFGLGAQFGALLPFSRKQESEADHLGLIFMAMAGYDPRATVPFWERMAASSKGGKPPEIMSTHPSDETRIANLNKLMPEAMKYYKPTAN
ncbi:MAG TPA: M48 family metallopeptidase [Candidatus Krumholzibacteria bacterium]|nr:M48 family metallopeptidase [Candidatus Krumholzibacteria bacterium]